MLWFEEARQTVRVLARVAAFYLVVSLLDTAGQGQLAGLLCVLGALYVAGWLLERGSVGQGRRSAAAFQPEARHAGRPALEVLAGVGGPARMPVAASGVAEAPVADTLVMAPVVAQGEPVTVAMAPAVCEPVPGEQQYAGGEDESPLARLLGVDPSPADGEEPLVEEYECEPRTEVEMGYQGVAAAVLEREAEPEPELEAASAPEGDVAIDGVHVEVVVRDHHDDGELAEERKSRGSGTLHQALHKALGEQRRIGSVASYLWEAVVTHPELGERTSFECFIGELCQVEITVSPGDPALRGGEPNHVWLDDAPSE
jgi:hypothetical protein